MSSDSDKRFEFKTDPANGFLIGPDGAHYNNERSAMFYSLSASCGCGLPGEIHSLFIQFLKQFSEEGTDASFFEVIEFVKDKPEVAAEFIAHYLTQEGLLEHGNSVYGSWLTERGKQFLFLVPPTFVFFGCSCFSTHIVSVDSGLAAGTVGDGQGHELPYFL